MSIRGEICPGFLTLPQRERVNLKGYSSSSSQGPYGSWDLSDTTESLSRAEIHKELDDPCGVISQGLL